MGNPILGTVDSVSAIDECGLKDFYQHYFQPKNMLISIAGKVPANDEIIQLLEKQISFDSQDSLVPFREQLQDSSPSAKTHLVKKPIEQMHLCFGIPAVPLGHPDQMSFTLFSTLLGGSMSSRLFQSIREQKGWAYSIYSYLSMYQKAGYLCIYGGLNKERLWDSVELIQDIAKGIVDDGVPDWELEKIKAQLKGQLVLGLESSSAWMQWMGRSYLQYQRVRSVDEVVAEVEAVTAAKLQSVASRLCDRSQQSITSIGPFSDTELSKYA